MYTTVEGSMTIDRQPFYEPTKFSRIPIPNGKRVRVLN
eukprot:SAG31_NODE_2513_length_5583_cov_1.886397_7_plen_37_part_01